MRPIAKDRAISLPSLGHDLDGHRLIAFVFQILRGPALGVVAGDAFEVDEGSVFAAQQTTGDRSTVNGIAGEREKMTGFGNHNLVRIDSGSTTHGRQKRYFVSVLGGGGAIGKLLIQGHHDAARNLAQARKTVAVQVENRIEASSIGQLDPVFAQAYNIPNDAEKQHSNAHRLILTDLPAGALVSAGCYNPGLMQSAGPVA